MEKSERSAKMLEFVRKLVDDENVQLRNGFSSCLKPTVLDCSYEDSTLTIAYDMTLAHTDMDGSVAKGILATVLDLSCGILVTGLNGSSYPPTIRINANFICPVHTGDTLICRSYARNFGSKTVNLYCEAFTKDHDGPVATATCVFISPRVWAS
ncbi:MAG: PaaI family thioesterase [Oscillospiraceae bacterium]|nr:PaaI family thioesterase [Oscillospiraceae bacterium]